MASGRTIVPTSVARSSPPPTNLHEQLERVFDEPLVLDEIDDPATLVARLAPQTFVRIARALRDEERLELLLPHAVPEQLTGLFDLDAWTEDQLDPVRSCAWLLAIAETYTTVKPRGALADLIFEMDPEMWTLGLSNGMMVADIDPSDDNARDGAAARMDDLRVWHTPDGFFLVGVPDDDLGRAALQTLNLVYADSLAAGRQLTLSIQSLVRSQVEEDLLRWRSGRLADLGFVDRAEAMKLFRPLDRTAAAQAERKDFQYLAADSDVGFGLQKWTGADLIGRVMGQLPLEERGVREREFLLLVNEVMAAQKFPPGSESLQERALHQTQATISLGLEMLAATTPDHPDLDAFLAERIQHIGLRDVFRVGYGALDKLRRAAHELNRATRISLTAPGSLLDRPWGPAVVGLMQLYPELALRETSTRTRPLRTLADVARATQSIAEAEALARLAFDPLGYAIDPIWLTRVDEPEKAVLGDLVRTAIVHTCLQAARHAASAVKGHGQDTMTPLGPDDLAWAHTHLLRSGELVPEIPRDFASRCDALGVGRHTTVLAENLLTRLRVELLALELDDDDRPDLTRVGGLLTVQHVGMWLTVRAGEGNN